MSNQDHESFVRFSLNERTQHAILLVTVTLLALTGLPQKYHNMGWARSLVDLMGGIDGIRLIHRTNAVILLAAFGYHTVFGLYRLLVKRAPFEMLPRLKDVLDFVYNIGYYLGVRKTRPRFDRFSYVEKFDYWAVFWGMAIMGGSGLVLWFPALVTRILPGVVVPISKTAHSDEALLAVSAILLWHLYNVHVNPRVFPFNKTVFTGRISRHELMTEHALEYERRTGERVPDGILSERLAPSWSVFLVSGSLHALLVALYVVLIVLAIRPPSVPRLSPVNTPIARAQVLPPVPSSTPAPLRRKQVPVGTSVTPTTAPANGELTGQQGPIVSHTIDGERRQCTVCHAVDGLMAVPENHRDITADECLECHAAASATPEGGSGGG